jgi:ATP-dependent DNA helicase RecG
VSAVRAVGPKRAAELAKFGLPTVEDLLYHLPFRYEDRRIRTPLRLVRPGEEMTCEGSVAGVRQGVAGRQRRSVLEVVLRDGGGTLVCVWFHGIAYHAPRFQVGQRLVVHGRVEAPLGAGPYRMVHPDVTPLDAEGAPDGLPPLVPIYEKPTPWPASAMRRIVHAAVDAYAARVPAGLPADVAARQRVVDPGRALRHVHQPPAEADLQALQHAASLAHRSLVFDELFFLQLGLALRRAAVGQEAGTAWTSDGRLGGRLRAALPFRPTGAQERAVAEIVADLAAPHPMRRLLQGDVGSGKTLVAVLAALAVIECGAQAALMAPTELLAEQHADAVRPLLAGLGLEAVLLTGAVKGRARKDALEQLASGRAALAVGTHALIQEGVRFARLGLAVVDEQHRFGVMQRAALQRQGDAAVDVLVMSATPIPRTLALTLYGDLAVSTLDELPPGRTPIATALCRERQRDRAYARIRDEVAAGHQAYVVYPLVEESEKSNLRAATTMAAELAQGPLAGLRVALVHGRMKADEKDAVMRAFKAHAHDVLVSTTVVEVGIDVPNATVMVVEHAERFGLAQLHQLRGRVGRGSAPGHCVLVVGDAAGNESWQRLQVLVETTDGFRIADADLQQRGPGDFLGTRQAGLPPFRVANLVRDTALLRAARDEALRWLEHDPDLSGPESAVTRAVLRHRWAGRLELARVG